MKLILIKIYRLLPRGMVLIENYRPKLHEIFAHQNFFAVKNNIKI